MKRLASSRLPVAWAILVVSLFGSALTTASAQGTTSVGVDVVPEGNTETSVAKVQSCASAKPGDTFIVDIIIDGVEDLLAWEIAVSYDPDVIRVAGRDVQLFLGAGSGSQVLDLSDKTPDEDGRYQLQSVDTADPLSPDNGSGILARLTLQAVSPGASPLSIDKVDLNKDGTPDRGVLLRNAAGDSIGDDDGDSLFDGAAAGGEIRVGELCPGADAENVVQTVPDPSGSTPGERESDEGWGTGLILGVALAGLAVLALAAAAAVVFLRRRRLER